MLVKTFFFNFYTVVFNFSFYLLIALFLASICLLFATLRRKFFFFLLVVILFSMWGFLFDLDGMILVLLTAEFTIALLLIMTYMQLYGSYEFFTIQKSKISTLFIVLLPFLLFKLDTTIYFYTNFYNLTAHIVASDFFILYYFLFEKIPLLIIFLTLIISFFSLFFIVLYYSLKFNKLRTKASLKNLYFLRKQVLIKQVGFNSRLYTFQA